MECIKYDEICVFFTARPFGIRLLFDVQKVRSIVYRLLI